MIKKTFVGTWASVCVCLLPLQVQAGSYIWDNQSGNGIWNDPVNWGINGNAGYNVAPIAGDTVIFRTSFAPGTITLTNHGFCARFRQQTDAPDRTITIHPGQTVDRNLTLDGTSAELFDFRSANTSFTFDGTTNGNGAKLRMVFNATASGCYLNGNAILTVKCNVSGTNGITLNAGDNDAGMLT